MAALDHEPGFDIVLMDIMMPVMDGYDTIRAIRRLERFRSLTVIAVTGKVMAGERMRCMDAGANDYVPKPVDVSDLFTALRPWLPQTPQATVPAPRPGERVLEGILVDADSRPPFSIGAKTLDGLRILVVDDDFRNIFAMTAILERGNAVVASAESGAEAIATLEQTPGIDLVLMDIMMPEMDGYDTIRAIRQMPGFQALPIVAVTGKAAAGERERCLQSGADDYVAKPVETGALLAALAPWIPAARTAVVS
jgi:CheY-like chemotaxis protein